MKSLAYYSCNVFPTYSVIRPIYVYDKKKSRRPVNYECLFTTSREISNENLKQNRPRGQMSQKAQKRIKNAVNWLAMATPRKKVYNAKTKQSFTFQLAFITLTLPSKQIHTDNEIKKEVLQPFLNYMRKAWMIKNYIWKAETQRNGNVHFHVAIDEFVHKKAICSVWNKMLSRLGYIGGAATTRIEAIKKVQDIGSYIAKYLGKNEKDRRPVTGKIWACSESLSEQSTRCHFETDNIADNYEKVQESALTKRKELIIYSKEDKEKERGFYIGDLLLYKWRTLLYRARSELKIMVTKICEAIRPPERDLFVNYAG